MKRPRNTDVAPVATPPGSLLDARAYGRRALRDKADRMDEAKQYETAGMLRHAADALAEADLIAARCEQKTYLYDQWGLRIAACSNDAPHDWHGWTGGNEDLRCPGRPSRV